MFLREVVFRDLPKEKGYPFHLPAFRGATRLNFNRFVTFLVGENGSGKSTLLEAIAIEAGFNPEGGARVNHFETVKTESSLGDYITLRWLPKVTDGFFFRAESFFNFASYIDDAAKEAFTRNPYGAYGGRSLHEQSHGESFLNLFTGRFATSRPALYLLDEPEAALSPARQLALLRILYDHQRLHRSQFIIATHSPILLGYPDAALLSFDGEGIQPILYEDTPHYVITKQFLTSPESMFRELFRDDET